MAPELIRALVDEDECDSSSGQSLDDSTSSSSKPKITTMSDVYAFASVCLEVCLLFSLHNRLVVLETDLTDLTRFLLGCHRPTTVPSPNERPCSDSRHHETHSTSTREFSV